MAALFLSLLFRFRHLGVLCTLCFPLLVSFLIMILSLTHLVTVIIVMYNLLVICVYVQMLLRQQLSPHLYRGHRTMSTENSFVLKKSLFINMYASQIHTYIYIYTFFNLLCINNIKS